MSGKCGDTVQDWHQVTRKMIFVIVVVKMAASEWPATAAQRCDDKLVTSGRPPLAKHGVDVADGVWGEGSSTLTGGTVSVLCVVKGTQHRRGGTDRCAVIQKMQGLEAPVNATHTVLRL